MYRNLPGYNEPSNAVELPEIPKRVRETGTRHWEDAGTISREQQLNAAAGTLASTQLMEKSTLSW
jgi:hypothetical protein